VYDVAYQSVFTERENVLYPHHQHLWLAWQAYFLQAAAAEVVEDLPCLEEEGGGEAAEEASCSYIELS
jgi:hypothetical protein